MQIATATTGRAAGLATQSATTDPAPKCTTPDIWRRSQYTKAATTTTVLSTTGTAATATKPRLCVKRPRGLKRPAQRKWATRRVRLDAPTATATTGRAAGLATQSATTDPAPKCTTPDIWRRSQYTKAATTTTVLSTTGTAAIATKPRLCVKRPRGLTRPARRKWSTRRVRLDAPTATATTGRAAGLATQFATMGPCITIRLLLTARTTTTVLSTTGTAATATKPRLCVKRPRGLKRPAQQKWATRRVRWDAPTATATTGRAAGLATQSATMDPAPKCTTPDIWRRSQYTKAATTTTVLSTTGTAAIATKPRLCVKRPRGLKRPARRKWATLRMRLDAPTATATTGRAAGLATQFATMGPCITIRLLLTARTTTTVLSTTGTAATATKPRLCVKRPRGLKRPAQQKWATRRVRWDAPTATATTGRAAGLATQSATMDPAPKCTTPDIWRRSQYTKAATTTTVLSTTGTAAIATKPRLCVKRPRGLKRPARRKWATRRVRLDAPTATATTGRAAGLATQFATMGPCITIRLLLTARTTTTVLSTTGTAAIATKPRLCVKRPRGLKRPAQQKWATRRVRLDAPTATATTGRAAGLATQSATTDPAPKCTTPDIWRRSQYTKAATTTTVLSTTGTAAIATKPRLCVKGPRGLKRPARRKWATRRVRLDAPTATATTGRAAGLATQFATMGPCITIRLLLTARTTTTVLSTTGTAAIATKPRLCVKRPRGLKRPAQQKWATRRVRLDAPTATATTGRAAGLATQSATTDPAPKCTTPDIWRRSQYTKAATTTTVLSTTGTAAIATKPRLCVKRPRGLKRPARRKWATRRVRLDAPTATATTGRAAGLATQFATMGPCITIRLLLTARTTTTVLSTTGTAATATKPRLCVKRPRGLKRPAQRKWATRRVRLDAPTATATTGRAAGLATQSATMDPAPKCTTPDIWRRSQYTKAATTTTVLSTTGTAATATKPRLCVKRPRGLKRPAQQKWATRRVRLDAPTATATTGRAAG